MNYRKPLLATLIVSVLLGTWAVFAQVPPGPGPSFFYSGPGTLISNTAVAQNILAPTITAGYVTNGVHCRVLAAFSTTASTAINTVTIQANYGTSASAALTGVSSTLPASAAASPMLIDLYLQQTIASPPTQELMGYVASGAGVYGGRVAGGITQPATGALPLNLSFAWGVASSNNVFQVQAANCSVGS